MKTKPGVCLHSILESVLEERLHFFNCHSQCSYLQYHSPTFYSCTMMAGIPLTSPSNLLCPDITHILCLSVSVSLCLSVSVCVCLSETGSVYETYADVQFTIPLPLLPVFWDYRCEPPHPAKWKDILSPSVGDGSQDLTHARQVLCH
jgi:hypothetical protein